MTDPDVEVFNRSLNKFLNRMAEGCCSSVSPCSHQQRDAYTICETCQKAMDLARNRHS